ncbi:MAG: hypothetical protein ACI8TP_002034 [Acidimicrobiales bacterium]|jgi:hypothetical protein
MQTPIDPARLLGRHSTVHTRSATYEGTILAAGIRGVSISVDQQVVRLTPGDVVSITAA